MSKTLTPDRVQNLITKAYCLEAISDKKDCTSRYVDLPGKPLEDFVIAGINAGFLFAPFAADRLAGESIIYRYFVAALKASNEHKSGKYVNFGLLELLFPVVASRLKYDGPAAVIAGIAEVMQAGSSQDVADMFDARRLAWQNSNNRESKLGRLPPDPSAFASPYAFYEHNLTADVDPSSRQWAVLFTTGQPLLKELFDGLQSHDGPLMNAIHDTFNPIRDRHPDISIGILADMTAAAIFLHLSYLD